MNKIDDIINQQSLALHLSDGVGSGKEARINVRWSTTDDYNAHYTDTARVGFHWNCHPQEYPASPADSHFYVPPNAVTDLMGIELSRTDKKPH